MKLVDRFTLWFLGVTLLIIPINSFITYMSIKSEIDKAAVERLKHVNQRVGEVLEKGQEPGEYTQGCRIKVVPVGDTKPADYYEITDRDVTHDPDLKDNDRKITVTSWHTVNGQHYKITSGDYVTRSEQILAGLRISIIAKLLILIALVVLTARLASRIVLAPFYSTLKKLQHFNLKAKKKLSLRPTRTKEFSELNTYVGKMTDKAVDDYISLKEFAENASHELQTPLAIIRSKLELLSESDIRGEQAVLISDMQNSVDKLTHINRSLVLLSRLENNEYESKEEVSFSKYAKEAMGTFEDLITLKGLRLSCRIADDVDVKLHAALVDILLNNLISNAIRHNIPNGRIEVVLDRDCLRIINTGVPPTGDPEEMFQRFKKGTQCNHSIGIGLSIVKQICDINSFQIRYQFASGLHVITIAFPGVSNSSKLLQNDERYLHEKIQL
ncbi:HAMP domain-containing sensor histidine kinase [Chitinophaga sp. YIM B06452]|uniref:sensor histidine kinase n=1 Tax=Chitinophaga sp. YIM B06452 TaxID=3082158 RepID=UPI0031FF3FD1